MFFNYPIAATADNWIHDSISYSFAQICDALNNATAVADWPNVLPSNHKDKLRTRRKLRDLLKDFATEAAKIDSVQRTEFISIFEQQNQIASLLDGTTPIPVISDALKPLVQSATDVCEEGFRLLTETGLRDKHYQIIWDSLKNKTCPFCGYEAFDAPTLPREDYDHYLLRTVYTLTATNFLNLVPMGSKCNQRYKQTNDILRSNNIRRKALNPYGNITANISLINSTLFDNPSGNPTWVITLTPDIEEIKTWEDVFSIRRRLTESIFEPYYKNEFYDDLVAWFSLHKVNNSTDNSAILTLLESLATYKRTHKIGHEYLKHKVIEMLVTHLRQGNDKIIRMIRRNLPPT